MESFSTEEQQVEAIKRFWKENGTAIILGAVIGLGGLWGWRYYNEQQIAGREAASSQYEQLLGKLDSNDKGFTEAAEFIKQNPDNSYALLTALQLAKKAVDSKDFAEAQKQLQWASEHAENAAVKGTIQIRLARVQSEQQQLDEALATLSTVESSAFSATVEEVKGDVLVKQGKIDQARSAYSQSLELNANNPLLQLKLDNLAATSE
ncbi:YfgM family protein [Neptunicella sp. SCSIO 80796]|uniref:YfgM family protein n=1 Tax=Neptunicella plasticusilytica TaxID=3117012 RepID=UPI003A4DEA6B